jgi:hypothetical protein
MRKNIKEYIEQLYKLDLSSIEYSFSGTSDSYNNLIYFEFKVIDTKEKIEDKK